MIICADFDGTIVRQDRAYDDLLSPLVLQPGCREALHQIKEAGHVVVVSSGRANRALREDWRLNPLWNAGRIPFDIALWNESRGLHQARYEQMLAFIRRELAVVVDAVDDGAQGKVVADVYVDDRALRFGEGRSGRGWPWFAHLYGALDRPGRAG